MKTIKQLTKEEYNKLDKIGMLYVLYPGATGEYSKDCDKELKIGDWVEYLLKTSMFHDDEIRIGVITEYKHGVVVIDEKITVQDIHIVRKLTRSEIESHLIKEAKRRGYKGGIQIRCPKYNKLHHLKDSGASYTYFKVGNDEYLTYYGWRVYSNGQWAEIVKEEPIKIGGYEVEFKKGEVKVECQYFTNYMIHCLNEISKFCKSTNQVITVNTYGDIILSDDIHNIVKKSYQCNKNVLDKIIKNLKD